MPGLMTGVRSFSLVDTQAVLPVQEDEPISSEKDNTSHHETDEKDESEKNIKYMYIYRFEVLYYDFMMMTHVCTVTMRDCMIVNCQIFKIL